MDAFIRSWGRRGVFFFFFFLPVGCVLEGGGVSEKFGKVRVRKVSRV